MQHEYIRTDEGNHRVAEREKSLPEIGILTGNHKHLCARRHSLSVSPFCAAAENICDGNEEDVDDDDDLLIIKPIIFFELPISFVDIIDPISRHF